MSRYGYSYGYSYSSGGRSHGYSSGYQGYGSYGRSKPRYNRGWGSSHHYDHGGSSTVRDTGRGSASRDHDMPRATGDAPKTLEEIRDECLEGGYLWEDPDFRAEDESLFYQNPPSVWPGVEWLRPSEICVDPELFVDGANRLDVNQGVLGDCWLLAAISCLATKPKLLHRVIPDGQSFQENYAGIFKFVFWQYGRWVEVLVDDRLPCCNGKLIYMHSDNRNEFWSPLLEKAYAKLSGSYESLSGGLTSEALTDFTGGIVERYELQANTPDDLFAQMLKANARHSLMGCSIDASPDEIEAKLDNGLIMGHAYSITAVRYIEVETETVSGKVAMIRVRNPWGESHEWKGAWSDDSPEWMFVSDEEKEAIGLVYEDDGEFWMSYEDWKDNYQRLEICYLGPDTLTGDEEGDEEEGEEGCAVVEQLRKWEGELFEGSWKRRVNAGGCLNYPKTFWTNPQYRVTITEADEGDEEGNGSIIVGLMQKNRRALKSEGKDDETIGYMIYHLEDPDHGTLDQRFFQTCRSADRSPSFINLREVSDHHRLPPGHYVIVPSTFEPNKEADFILRVYSEIKQDVNELDDATVGGNDVDDEEDEEEIEEDEVLEGLVASFKEIAGDDAEVDAYELKDLLHDQFADEFEVEDFSLEICRSMVAMNDEHLTGKLCFSDFKNLWEDLMRCKKAFKKYDFEDKKYFDSYHFRSVLRHLKLRVSNATFNAIVMRYSDKEGHVRFDDFVSCFIRLKTTFEIFKANDTDGDGEASFKLDQFVQQSMYS